MGDWRINQTLGEALIFMSDTYGDNGFDKSARSLLDTLRIFEREAELLLEGFGFDPSAVSAVVASSGGAVADIARVLLATVTTVGGKAGAAGGRAQEDFDGVLAEISALRRTEQSLAARLEMLEAGQAKLDESLDVLESVVERGQHTTDSLGERIGALEAKLANRRNRKVSKNADPTDRRESQARASDPVRRSETAAESSLLG
ncbi:MAG: BMFP domain-containing protein YqiC [Hyphomicrobiaceae bacterium]